MAASDAFFPFPDGLEVLIEAGVKAVVQPGGSIRDNLVIEAAEQGRHDRLPDRHPALLPLMSRTVVQDATFSGEDWALAEVDRVRYEDCAFHDVDWSEARLTGCVFSHCDVRQRPVQRGRAGQACAILHSTFRKCSFFDATLTDCKLTGTQFLDCGLRPLTVNGGDWAFVPLRGQN